MLSTGADLAIVTAHPFDISGMRVQASIKKIECLPAYRLILLPDEEAQELAVRRGKMIAVAMQMGPAGRPREVRGGTCARSAEGSRPR